MQGILFDLGNTLIRVRGSVGLVYANWAKNYDLTFDPQVLDQRFNRAFKDIPKVDFSTTTDWEACERDWWRKVVIQTLGTEFAHFDQGFDELYGLFAQAIVWECYPEVIRVLESLTQQGVRLGVVSNFDARLIPLLAGLKLDHYFSVVVHSTQVGYAKPHPQIFQIALERMGTLPVQTLHIGDSWTEDVLGAQALGINALWLNRKGGHLERQPQIQNLDQIVTGACER